jgi:5-methylcytosine-specific restriction endonuclease McrA
MSFDKKYENRKDQRKPFYGAKSVDHQCRNHGSCTYCQQNRTFDITKNEIIFKSELENLERDPVDIMIG